MAAPQRWIALLVVVIAAVVGVNRFGATDHPAQAPAATATTTTNVVWSHGQSGGSQNAEAHWQKHGREFPEFHSAEDYERGALRFVTNPPPGTLKKSRENGDTLYYDPATNTFAVKDRSGEPRTFFRPNNGRAYWDRQ
jgi:pyocin large subunit-like protein